MARRKPLRRDPVEERRFVYRVVDKGTLDDLGELASCFLPDKDDPDKEPDERELKYPILQEGLSVYSTEDLARLRWAGMRKNATHRGEEKVHQGEFLAEIELTPGEGFFLEDRKKRDGHLTIWGDSLKLAGAVRRIFLAERREE